MCPVIISTHISKMLSTAESKRPWRAKAAYPYMKAQGGGVILNASKDAFINVTAPWTNHWSKRREEKENNEMH